MKLYHLAAITILSLMIIWNMASSQITQEWLARYSYGAGQAKALSLDDSGNIFITGNSASDIATIKYSPEGDTLWVSRFAGGGNDFEQVYDIQADHEGDVIIGLTAKYFVGQGLSKDFVTIKYHGEDGAENWVNIWENPYAPDNDDDPHDVEVDAANMVYVTGRVFHGSSSTPAGTGFDWLTMCYWPHGLVHWEERWDGNISGDRADEVEVTPDGVTFVVGSTYRSGYYELRIVKYDWYGGDWERYYDAYGYQPYGRLAIDSLQNSYVAAAIGIAGSKELFVLKYDSLGTLEFESTYSFPESEDNVPISIVTDSQGYPIVLCEISLESGGSRTHIIKYNPDGDTLWTATPNPGSTWQHPSAIALDEQDNIYITGSLGLYDVMKFGPDGEMLWEVGIEGASSFGGVDIEIDDYNNIYVLGGIGMDFGTVKFSQNTGIEDEQIASHPAEFALYGNHPNPFNPMTAISFNLPVASEVRLDVFDINGRNVGARRASPLSGSGTTPTTGFYPAGTHQITFDGSGISSGIYIYRLTAGDFNGVGKMVLMK